MYPAGYVLYNIYNIGPPTATIRYSPIKLIKLFSIIFWRDIKDLLPIINGHNPGGSSVMTAAQFAQNYNAGKHKKM